MYVHSRVVKLCFVVGLAAGVNFLPAQELGKGKTVPIKADSPVYKKWIVAVDDVPIHRAPSGEKIRGGKIFDVFVELKPEDGTQVPAGWICVGDPAGKIFGYMSQQDVETGKRDKSPPLVAWNTRIVLQPVKSASEKTSLAPGEDPAAFSVVVDKGKFAGKEFVPPIAAEQQPLAVVLDEPTDKDGYPLYKVAFFAGQESGSAAAPSLEIEDASIDIVFAIDATASMGPLIGMARKIASKLSESIAHDPELKQNLRFGLVSYQDTSPGLTPSRMHLKLTAGTTELERQLSMLEAATVESIEFKEDVYAGIQTCLDAKMGWTQDRLTLKNIIILGDAAPLNESQREEERSKATTELSIPKIAASVAPTGGEQIRQLVDRKRISAVQLIHSGTQEEQETIDCQHVFKTLTSKCGGFFEAVEEGGEELDALITSLHTDISEAAKVFKSDTGRQGTSPKRGSLPRSTLFKAEAMALKEAIGGEGVPAGVYTGTAHAVFVKPGHFENGVQTARECVFVIHYDLISMRDNLEFLHKKLEGLGGADVATRLEQIQGTVANILAGQREITASTKLNILIEALPLRTEIFEVSPEGLAAETAAGFDEWVRKLKEVADGLTELEKKIEAEKRFIRLFEGIDDSSSTPSKKFQSEYSVINLAQLP